MPNTNRTKQELSKSLKELMQTVPLERISVGDIAEQAGLGRNTFYYHFQDKYDLVNWIFEVEAARLLRQKLTADNWDVCLNTIEEYFRANKSFYCNALAYSGQNCLKDYIHDSIRTMVLEQTAALPQQGDLGLTEEDIGVVGDVVAYTFLGMLIHWTNNGMPENTRSFHECLRRIADGSLVRWWLRGSEKLKN